MPKGPKGEKRPSDVIGAAVMVGRIATGDEKDTKRSIETEARISEISLARTALIAAHASFRYGPNRYAMPKSTVCVFSFTSAAMASPLTTAPLNPGKKVPLSLP